MPKEKMNYSKGHDKLSPAGAKSMESYRDSSAKTRPGANRHGFSANTKTSHASGPMRSDPFPANRDMAGPQFPGKRGNR